MVFWNDMTRSQYALLLTCYAGTFILGGDRTLPQGGSTHACKNHWSYELKQALNGTAHCERTNAAWGGGGS